jgi:hypothetical protein
MHLQLKWALRFRSRKLSLGVMMGERFGRDIY